MYALLVLRETEQIYKSMSSDLSNQAPIAKTVQIGDKALAIPTYELFKPGNIWALVSKSHPLTGEAGYELVDIPVAHGDSDMPMMVAVNITDELEQLVNAAEVDGESLMVSSAYRSLEEQKQIYDEFVADDGEAAAAQYVLPVGASEHHTGLSVDFSSLSDECAADSDTCSLSQSSAAWLADNAHKYGFILRYMDGKRDITGVRYEPWHYRFVGKPMALAIHGSNLTYEEVLNEIAPGYNKVR
jgi:D-alanyl-D-alanine carboxypeptidase